MKRKRSEIRKNAIYSAKCTVMCRFEQNEQLQHCKKKNACPPLISYLYFHLYEVIKFQQCLKICLFIYTVYCRKHKYSLACRATNIYEQEQRKDSCRNLITKHPQNVNLQYVKHFVEELLQEEGFVKLMRFVEFCFDFIVIFNFFPHNRCVHSSKNVSFLLNLGATRAL